MNSNDTAAAGLGIAMILFLFVAILAFYIFFCFCNKRICEKCGVTPGILIWIPILQLIPLLQAAQLSTWMILLFLIPFVSIIMAIVMWVKICTTRGKGVLAILLVLILPFIGIPYLAFSE